MLFDLMVFSRTIKNDYRWIFKPEYIDSVILDVCNDMKRLFEATGKKEFIRSEGRENFFFIPSNNGCALLRVRESDAQDQMGRQIYSIEGIATYKTKTKELWWLLPRLIETMISNDKIYRNSIDNNTSIKSTNTTQVDLALDNYRGSLTLTNQLARDQQKSCFPFSFSLGSKPVDFFPHRFEKHYLLSDKEDVDHEEDIMYIPVESNPAGTASRPSCSIFLEFTRRKRQFVAIARAINNDGETLVESDDIPFEDNGIDVSLIYAAVSIISEQLNDMGYVTKGDITRTFFLE